MAARRSDDRGSRGGGLSRAETLDLCARLASYAEAGGTPRDLVRRAGGDAVGRFPDDIDVLVAAGRMYLMAEELDEAERTLRHAVRVASREPHALRLLGEVLLRKGEPVAAHGALSSSVAAGMHDPWTKIWVSRALDYAELLADLGPEGVARDVRQVLGKPGQGPPDDGRRSSPPARQSAPPARVLNLKQARPIDRGVFFPGDARAELPDLQPDPWALAPGEIVDLPPPGPPAARPPGAPTPPPSRATRSAPPSPATRAGPATPPGRRSPSGPRSPPGSRGLRAPPAPAPAGATQASRAPAPLRRRACRRAPSATQASRAPAPLRRRACR
ncbi:MAG: hypothetical protein R3F14_18805 [Polyangiaceae bacterium]